MSKDIERLRGLSERAARYSALGQARQTQRSSMELTTDLPIEEIVSRSRTIASLDQRLGRITLVTDRLTSEAENQDLKIRQGLEDLAPLAESNPTIAAVYEPLRSEYLSFTKEKTETKKESSTQSPQAEHIVTHRGSTFTDEHRIHMSIAQVNRRKREAQGIASELEEPKKQRIPHRKSEESYKDVENKPAKRRTGNITLQFRGGEEQIIRNNMPGAGIKLLITKSRSVGELAKKLHGEDSPRNRELIMSHDLTRMRAIARANGYTILGIEKGNDIVHSLRKIKKQSANNTSKPEARSYEKNAKKDIYLKGSFRIETPQGKIVEIKGGLCAAIADAYKRGITDRDGLAEDIYPEVSDKTRKRIDAGTAKFNRQLEPYNSSFVREPITLKEIKEGKPVVYIWKEIEKDALAESIESEEITNYEAAVIFSILNDDETRKSFKENDIPLLDSEVIMKIFDTVEDRKAPSQKEMDSIRQVIITKLKEIHDNDRVDEVYDACGESVKLLLAYFVDLDGKRDKAFDLLIQKLRTKGLKWVVDQGNIFHIGSPEELIPTPTPVSRWERGRREPVHDTSLADNPRARIAEIETSEPIGSAETKALAARFPDLFEKDPYFESHIKSSLEFTLSNIPALSKSVTDLISQKLIIENLDIKREFIKKIESSKYIDDRLVNSRDRRVLRLVSVVIMQYLAENFPNLNFNLNAKLQLKEYAEEAIHNMIVSEER